MSRNLYTVAVVSRELEFQLRALLQQPDAPIEAAERTLFEALAQPEPRVAFFRVLLDGWNCTHRLFEPKRPTAPSERWWIDLGRAGFAWPSAQSLDVGSELGDAPGEYAMSALRATFGDAAEFANATDCATLVLWRCIGASHSDDGFQHVPAFGEYADDVRYRYRPSSYAVLRDGDGRIAVIESNGNVFLPGGGAEPQETPAQALERELHEEIGWSAHITRDLGRAVEYVHAEGEGHFAKLGTFFEAALESPIAGTKAAEYAIVWLPVTEAVERLAHGSHRWAVRKATGSI